MKNNFSTWIKKTGLKKATVADDLGIGPTWMAGLCQGKKLPSVILALKIERYTKGEVPCEAWEHEHLSET